MFELNKGESKENFGTKKMIEISDAEKIIFLLVCYPTSAHIMTVPPPPKSAYIVSYNDLTNDNYNAYIPEIIKKLKNASHIAVDIEFTAVGNIQARDMNKRYATMKQTAEAASMVSLGISIFTCLSKEPLDSPTATTFTFSDLSLDEQPCQKSGRRVLPGVSSTQPVIQLTTTTVPPHSSSQPVSYTLTKEEEASILSSILEEEQQEASMLSEEEKSKQQLDEEMKLLESIMEEEEEFSIDGIYDAITPINTQTSETKIPNVSSVHALNIAEEIIPPPPQKVHYRQYMCDNFNFLTLKQGTIQMETSTAVFLSNQNYSFDRLFKEGIPFTPPEIKKPKSKPKPPPKAEDVKLNTLWKHILDISRSNNIPLVFHNGLYDLVYIYSSFIGALPSTFPTFLTEISNRIPSGIYDTKYLAKEAHFDANFLSYVFSYTDRLRQARFETSTADRPYFDVVVNDPLIGTKRKRGPEIVYHTIQKRQRFCRFFAVSCMK